MPPAADQGFQQMAALRRPAGKHVRGKERPQGKALFRFRSQIAKAKGDPGPVVKAKQLEIGQVNLQGVPIAFAGDSATIAAAAAAEEEQKKKEEEEDNSFYDDVITLLNNRSK